MNVTLWMQPGNRPSEQAEMALKFRNIAYEEKRIGYNVTMDDFLAQFPNTSELPQVIIDNTNIGSYQQLEDYLIEHWKLP